MATFTESRIRQRAQQKTGTLRKAATVLREEVAATKTKTSFDIFLSHSTPAGENMWGVRAARED